MEFILCVFFFHSTVLLSIHYGPDAVIDSGEPAMTPNKRPFVELMIWGKEGEGRRPSKQLQALQLVMAVNKENKVE